MGWALLPDQIAGQKPPGREQRVDRPRFPVVDGGEADLDGLLDGIADALVIHRIDVVPSTDPTAGPWTRTLVAPDGALRMRDGAVAGAVAPFLLEVDLGQFFATIDLAGQQARAGGAVVPWLRTGDLTRFGLRSLGGQG